MFASVLAFAHRLRALSLFVNLTPGELKIVDSLLHEREFLKDEVIFDKAASTDKDYVVIEGALHGFTPCVACETTRGQYSNSVRNLFDYIQKWINARF